MPNQRVLTFNGERVVAAEQLITLLDYWLGQQYRQRLANRYADGEFPIADDVEWAVLIGQAVALLDDYEDFHLDYLQAEHRERVANLRLTDPHSYAINFRLNTNDLADGWEAACEDWWDNTDHEPRWFRTIDGAMRPVARVMENTEAELYDQNTYTSEEDWNLINADGDWMNINSLVGNFGWEDADYETDSEDEDDNGLVADYDSDGGDDSDDENNNNYDDDIIG